MLRLYILLRQGALSTVPPMPITWYAGIPLLCLVPVLFFILSIDEDRFRFALPLISLNKALTIPGLIVFAGTAAPTALRFGAAGQEVLLESIAAALLFVIGDAISGVYCFRRSRILCK